MLHTISWQGYWTTLALITVGYYLAIYLLYFRKDFGIISYRKLIKAEEDTPLPSSEKPDNAHIQTNQP
ncbi:MAG TPA: hypothetical protein VNS32_21515, partial [Flavisolibacter sp.]|nr:hypothetical protein [Flavisolibacter sp.]